METSNSTGGLAERLKGWRSELRGIGLTKDDRDELQAHMEDVLEELLGKGLNEDEAWMVASHRVGAVPDIKSEYKKAYVARIPLFNHVLFWIILLFFTITIVSIGADMVSYITRIGQAPIFSVFCLIILALIVYGIISNRKNFRALNKVKVFMLAVPLIFISLIFAFLTNFDGPECYNPNEFFPNHSPRSEVYVKALLKRFAETGSDNLYYRFAYYYKEGSKDFVVLKVIGNDFCGFMSLDVSQSKRLEHLIKVKGMGYGGSNWRGLRFETEAGNSGFRFIFKSVEHIVD
jgi:hypothetical protein